MTARVSGTMVLVGQQFVWMCLTTPVGSILRGGWWMIVEKKVQKRSIKGATPFSHAKRLGCSVSYGQKLATLPERRRLSESNRPDAFPPW